MQKENAAAQEEMRRISEKIDRNEERFRQLSNKVDKNKMADAEMAAELQSLQAGEERRGSSASQTGDCCLEEMFQRVVALGTNGVEVLFQRTQREIGAAPGQMPGREGRRISEDEQKQSRFSKQLVHPAPGGINEGTPASSVELDLPRAQGAWRCGGAGKSGTLGIAREVYQTLQADVQWKRMHSRKTCEWKWDEKDFCRKRKEKRNSQGKDPRAFDKKSQGGDVSTLERNRQGEDPRTLKENSQGRDLGTFEANSHGKDPRTF